MKSIKQCFIGIDVSKLTFDAALMIVIHHQRQSIITKQFANNPLGLRAFARWLRQHQVAFDEHTLVVMENTGIYHRLLWQFCSAKNIPLYIGNAAHIKWSLGITRGKDDTTDSIRLCMYACKEAETLKAAPPLNPVIIRLKDLWTSRRRLLEQLNANRTYLGELKGTTGAATHALLAAAYQTAIDGLKASIKSVEAQIKTILDHHADLQKNYALLRTVPGIGHITAVYLLGCTANFAANPSGKQLACYAGLAPFAHTSGTSIRGRTKVHKMANKELKRLLYMGAMSAIQHNKELGDYYRRRVSEGKHELSVLNAVKNKIVLRVAAVIAHQKPYTDNVKPFQKNKSENVLVIS